METLESRELLAADLVITELMASNRTTLEDRDQDRPDWIEIHNPTLQRVELFGWSLTDDPQEPGKWQFPYIGIDAGDYLLVFASGKDRPLDSFRLRGDLHAVRDGTFLVDLPDGTYDVRLTMGDPKVVRDEVAVSIQGAVVETLTVAAGDYATRNYTADVDAASGGQLAVRIEDRGGLIGRGGINTLIVTPAGGGPARRFDFGEAGSPVEPGFVGVTQDDVYSSEAGHGWEAGSDVRDQDRGVDFDELHTSFRLNSDGEYLGLVAPDGTTVVSSYTYPAQQADVSYGLPQAVIETTPVAFGAAATTLVPSVANGGDALGTRWTAVDFEDGAWTAGPTGIGYERGSAFENLIQTDTETEMYATNATAYVRVPFVLDDPRGIYSLVLRMKYDDGYVAYLNGVEVARRNAPDTPAWNSQAVRAHLDEESIVFEDVDLSGFIDQLRAGDNVLAIHGMNLSPDSDHLLVVPELVARRGAEITAAEPRFFDAPSPYAPGGVVSFSGFTAAPTTSVRHGVFDAPFDLTVATATPGATIVYTTDGSVPSLDHGVAVPPPDAETAPSVELPLSETTVMRMAAVHDTLLPSTITTASYIFPGDVASQTYQATLDAGFPDNWGNTPPDYGMDPDVIGPDDLFHGEFAGQLVDSLTSIPTISLVTDVDNMFGRGFGIYQNPEGRGMPWERPTSVEFIYPDGSPGAQVDAGVRILGGASRSLSSTRKKSFRLVFRQEYGPGMFEFPLFGDEAAGSFDQLVLRGGFNDAWSWAASREKALYVRDVWASEAHRAMGKVTPHGTFMHLYINGIYWGLYLPEERPESSFAASYFGGDSDEWDVLNTGVLVDGSFTAWGDIRTVTDRMRTEDQQAGNAALQELQGNLPDGTDSPDVETLMDVENYIDYLILNMYGGNGDWPDRNWYAARRRGPESTGYKFFSWDAEFMWNLFRTNVNSDLTQVSDGVAAWLLRMRENDEFRLQFADRIHQHFFNGGVFYVDPAHSEWDPAHPERNRPAALFKGLADEVELAIIAESARWGDQHWTQPGTLHEWRTERDSLLNDYFPRRSAIVLDQFVAAGLYPDVDAPVFSQHGGEVPAGFALSMSTAGETYFTIDGSDPRLNAFGRPSDGIGPAARRYDGPITIDANTVVKARTLVDGQWSALNEASFTLGPPPLRISEIMYHPHDPEPGSAFGDDDDFEFIELVNTSPDRSVSLQDVAFTDGIAFTFPDMLLAPGEHIVVARNRDAFVERYGDSIPVAGQYGGGENDLRLSNRGERLELRDANGQVIQQFDYHEAWHPSTDGDGYSLEILDAAHADLARWGTPDGWLPSLAVGGTPGRARADVAVTPGDANLDGQVTSDDIADFVLGLTRPGQYTARLGVPPTLTGDVDGDGDQDFDDLEAFATLLAAAAAAQQTDADASEPPRRIARDPRPTVPDTIAAEPARPVEASVPAVREPDRPPRKRRR